MGPLAQAIFPHLKTKESREAMFEMMHVHVEEGMATRVMHLNVETMGSDFEGKMPAPTVFIEGFFPEENGEHEVGIIVSRGPLHFFGFGAGFYDVDDVYIYLTFPNNIPGKRIIEYARYSPRSDSFEPLAFKNDDEDFAYAYDIAGSIDLLFAFMAEPRFVRQESVSRLKRTMAAKKIGKMALRHTWVKLGWTVGGSTRAKGNVPGSAPQKAYHMVRAHWREYDRQTPKAERRPHRPGWWVWIETYHSGNPALGEIKHHYRPKLDDPGKSSRTVHAVIAARIATGLDRKAVLPPLQATAGSLSNGSPGGIRPATQNPLDKGLKQ